MTALFLYDDAIARGFEPFALTRPVSELRAGAEIIRRRWERALGVEAAGFMGAGHLADFDEPGAPPAVCDDSDLGPAAIVANARCVVPIVDRAKRSHASVWTCGGRVAAVRVKSSVHAALFADGKLSMDELTVNTGAFAEIGGRWMENVWDLIATLGQQLQEDIEPWGKSLETFDPADVIRVGEHHVFCESGATVEPHVVFDSSAGPILVRRGAHVSAFTRLVGPCYIGEGAVVLGDRIATSSIGDSCKVRGELSHTIMLGHSNKGHTGFVGHSYFGRWVNLGAGTTTSNLKNTYGSVQLATKAGLVDTGQQFVGTFFGDHAKTGIGTMLNTGTIIGAGANVFGTHMPPKSVPPFAWGEGEPYDRYELEKFIDVAGRMMARRHAALSKKGKSALRAAYGAAGRSRPA